MYTHNLRNNDLFYIRHFSWRYMLNGALKMLMSFGNNQTLSYNDTIKLKSSQLFSLISLKNLLTLFVLYVYAYSNDILLWPRFLYLALITNSYPLIYNSDLHDTRLEYFFFLKRTMDLTSTKIATMGKHDEDTSYVIIVSHENYLNLTHKLKHSVITQFP
ncbi:Reverse transcriptase domain-containing protein [Aphis craccivora]|uniref:Reverse transcriptase domain-containing protein n=1 Tax=Aphis craccivora TaxID=307492 RepID=A0A6G0Z195_APHCR|nr:Reverse transcriptase domain-containing protein [Aphis craccivora]